MTSGIDGPWQINRLCAGLIWLGRRSSQGKEDDQASLGLSERRWVNWSRVLAWGEGQKARVLNIWQCVQGVSASVASRRRDRQLA